MNVYFAGAIRGGREKVFDYQMMVRRFEKNNCVILNKHVADPNLLQNGEFITENANNNLTLREKYDRDCAWLKETNILFADITIPSLGVGYEISQAEKYGKKVYAVYELGKNVSGLIRGNPNIDVVPYKSIDEVLELIDRICYNWSNNG